MGSSPTICINDLHYFIALLCNPRSVGPLETTLGTGLTRDYTFPRHSYTFTRVNIFRGTKEHRFLKTRKIWQFTNEMLHIGGVFFLSFVKKTLRKLDFNNIYHIFWLKIIDIVKNKVKKVESLIKIHEAPEKSHTFSRLWFLHLILFFKIKCSQRH